MPGPSTSPHQSYTQTQSGTANMPSSSPGYDPTAQRASSSFADRAADVFAEMKKNAAADMATGCANCGGCAAEGCKAKDLGKEYKKAPPEVMNAVREKMDSYGSFGGGTVFDQVASSIGMDFNPNMDNGKSTTPGDQRFQANQQNQSGLNNVDWVSGIGRAGVSNSGAQGSFVGRDSSAPTANPQQRTETRIDTRGAESKASESRWGERSPEGKEHKAEPKSDPRTEAKIDSKSEKGAEKRAEATSQSAQSAASINNAPRPDVKPETATQRTAGRSATEDELLRNAEAIRKMTDAVKKVESVFVKTGSDGQASFTTTTTKNIGELGKAVQALAQVVAAGEKLSADLQRASHRVAMLDKMLNTGPSGMNPETVVRLVRSSLPEITGLIKASTAQVERRVEPAAANRPAAVTPEASRPAPSIPQRPNAQPSVQQYTTPSRPSAAVHSGPALTAGMRQVDVRPNSPNRPSVSTSATTSTTTSRGVNLGVAASAEMSARQAAFRGQIANIRAGLDRIQTNLAANPSRSTVGGFSRRAHPEQQTFERQLNRVDPRTAIKATRGTGTETPASLRERLMDRAVKMRQQLEKTLKRLERTGPDGLHKDKLTPAERRERALKRMEMRERKREDRDLKRKDDKLGPKKDLRKLDPRERDLRRKDAKGTELDKGEKGDRRDRLNRRFDDTKLEAGREKLRAERIGKQTTREKNFDKRADQREQGERRLARQLKRNTDGVTLSQREVSTLISLLNSKTKSKQSLGREEDSIAGMLSPMEQRALAKILKKLPKDASLDAVRKSLKKDRMKNGASKQVAASPATKKQQGNAAQGAQQNNNPEGKTTTDGQQPSKSLDLNSSKVGDGKRDDAEFPLAV